MDKEGYFISGFKNKKIGDDGAVIGNLVYSKDLFCENIHFKLSWMSLKQIAIKSMLVNISDAIAMNAKPKHALIGLVLPSNFSLLQLQELSYAFEETAKKYNFEIIGGDTTSGDKLMISITLISQTKKPIYRKTMKKGDLIAFTGKLGNSKKDLNKLLREGKVHTNSKFVTPLLKADFIYEAAKYINAGLDISDGLSKDLSRLCKSSRNLGAKFLINLAKKDLCSGEEYEMLFSFSPKNLAKIKSIAKKNRTQITIFAKAVTGKYTSCCKENHF
ncbi:thiamine-phosphate kinase [Sulfurospirillum arcachonense]|uniref:thiamine-phosphate kinase n=1 Tax=Sulfurospirillum arcachonense TaxID=57666 RepID=UPI00046A4567|nr:thiamine-phosphate kinase [Sulfurospirillum arcachonense]